jgi:hypothetical protein
VKNVMEEESKSGREGKDLFVDLNSGENGEFHNYG